MITDKQLYFSDEQALAPGNSTKILDMGLPDAGVGDDLDFFVLVDGAPASALTVTLQGADDAAFTAPVTIATYPVAAADVAKGGKVRSGRLPRGCRRFLRLAYAGVSGGTVTAGIVKDS